VHGTNGATADGRSASHTILHLGFLPRSVLRERHRPRCEGPLLRRRGRHANQLTELVKAAGATSRVKSKSMLSEEIGINERLGEAGVEWWKPDLANGSSSLPTKRRLTSSSGDSQEAADIRRFSERGHRKARAEPRCSPGYARRRLRQKFEEADVGITGCKLPVAETGSIVLSPTRGNGRMVTTLPRCTSSSWNGANRSDRSDDLESWESPARSAPGKR